MLSVIVGMSITTSGVTLLTRFPVSCSILTKNFSTSWNANAAWLGDWLNFATSNNQMPMKVRLLSVNVPK